MAFRAGQVPVPPGRSRAAAHLVQIGGQHGQRRHQGGGVGPHDLQQCGVETHAVFQGVHPRDDGVARSRLVLGVHGDPPTDGVHRLDHTAQDVDGHGFVVQPPIADDLAPTGGRRLLRGHGRQSVVGHAAPPPLEELARARQPGTGMAGVRQLRVRAEPGRRLTGKAGAAHRRHPGIHLTHQVLAQQPLVQPVPGPLGARMRVHIDQARQHPPLGHDVGADGGVVHPHAVHTDQIDRLAGPHLNSANANAYPHAIAAPNPSRSQPAVPIVGRGEDSGSCSRPGGSMSSTDFHRSADDVGGHAPRQGRVRRLVGRLMLAVGVLSVAFALSPLSPHATSAVVVAPTGASVPIRVEVTDRGGSRVAVLGELGEGVDLATPSVGEVFPVLTYPSGRVVYDTGEVRPTLWALSVAITVAGGVLLLVGRRARRVLAVSTGRG
jgi:hypothetical protein